MLTSGRSLPPPPPPPGPTDQQVPTDTPTELPLTALIGTEIERQPGEWTSISQGTCPSHLPVRTIEPIYSSTPPPAYSRAPPVYSRPPPASPVPGGGRMLAPCEVALPSHPPPLCRVSYFGPPDHELAYDLQEIDTQSLFHGSPAELSLLEEQDSEASSGSFSSDGEDSQAPSEGGVLYDLDDQRVLTDSTYITHLPQQYVPTFNQPFPVARDQYPTEAAISVQRNHGYMDPCPGSPETAPALPEWGVKQEVVASAACGGGGHLMGMLPGHLDALGGELQAGTTPDEAEDHHETWTLQEVDETMLSLLQQGEFGDLESSSDDVRDELPPYQPRQPRTGANNRTRRRRKNQQIWEFLAEILGDCRTNPSIIRWEDRDTGVFKIVKSQLVAQEWGRRKNKPKMTYEHLSRAMRFYYKRNVMYSVPRVRLTYQFGPEAVNWREMVSGTCL